MANPLQMIGHRLLPAHLADRRPDPLSPHRRRFTPEYLRKRQRVKQLWMGAGLLVLLQPTITTLLIVGITTTFVAFTILDESC